MEVVFKKTAKYICDNCDVQFDWTKESVAYGKPEYKTVQEQREIEKVFCTEKCYKEWKK